MLIHILCHGYTKTEIVYKQWEQQALGDVIILLFMTGQFLSRHVAVKQIESKMF